MASECATSAGRRAGRARTCAASRRAWPARAAGEAADSGQATATGATRRPSSGPAVGSAVRSAAVSAGAEARGVAGGTGPGAVAGAARSGGAETARWQLVPPMPNELTPASSGPSRSGHAPSSRCTRRASASRGMSGLGAVKCRLAGSSRCRSASATLSRPTTPAAPSRWPTLVFTEPTSSGSAAGRPAPSAAPRAAASTGSPTLVPVPCSSTYCTRAGSMPARRQADLTTSSCARRSGTVSPAPPPSLFTALPRITQCTGSPSASAAASSLSTTKPPPSPRT